MTKNEKIQKEKRQHLLFKEKHKNILSDAKSRDNIKRTGPVDRIQSTENNRKLEDQKCKQQKTKKMNSTV